MPEAPSWCPWLGRLRRSFGKVMRLAWQVKKSAENNEALAGSMVGEQDVLFVYEDYKTGTREQRV